MSLFQNYRVDYGQHCDFLPAYFSCTSAQAKRTADTNNSTHNGSKDPAWHKELLSQQMCFSILISLVLV